MADWGDTIEDLIAWRDAWIEEYGIDWGNKENRVLSLEDMSQLDHERLKKLDKENLVWTNHSTCEDEYFTPGYHVFEGSGCGCWVTYSFYIAEVPWEDENERIDATAHLPCPVCNEDGEGEGDPDCEGPKLPESEYGVNLADGCEEGFIQVYLD